MFCDCPNDKRADICEVQQHVAIDLVEAFKNKCLPSMINDEDLQFGNIHDASNIAGRASDVFEAMQQNRAFSEALSSKDKKDE